LIGAAEKLTDAGNLLLRLMEDKERLRQVGQELANDLEAEIDAKYGMQHGQRHISPMEQVRYLRDMEPVHRARKILGAVEPDQTINKDSPGNGAQDGQDTQDTEAANGRKTHGGLA
jgi:hypothetical protein